MSAWLRTAARALLEVVLPAHCVRCDREVAAGGGRGVAGGLRWCDTPPLCRACRESLLCPEPLFVTLGKVGSTLPAAAGMPTNAGLVEIVSCWKYRGYRGLAVPLSALVDAAWDIAETVGGPVDMLVPMPLHPRRRRERGFNQAELLARLVGRRRSLPVHADLLVRRRATAQQAKLSSRSADRGRNVSGAFALAGRGAGEIGRVGLVDDLVTSGATALAAAACLREGGVSVSWILAAGAVRARSPGRA